jgi:hypothetical protein
MSRLSDCYTPVKTDDLLNFDSMRAFLSTDDDESRNLHQIYDSNGPQN